MLTARPTLADVLAEVDRLRAFVMAAMDGPEEPEERLGTKQAAYIWQISERAALKRLRRIGTQGLDGRWTAPRSAVEAASGIRQPELKRTK